MITEQNNIIVGGSDDLMYRKNYKNMLKSEDIIIGNILESTFNEYYIIIGVDGTDFNIKNLFLSESYIVNLSNVEKTFKLIYNEEFNLILSNKELEAYKKISEGNIELNKVKVAKKYLDERN